MACPYVPKEETRDLLGKMGDSGHEHAYVQCSDGEIIGPVEGDRESVYIGESVEECGDRTPVTIIHTHPGGHDELSDADRSVAADDDVKSVCVAVNDPTDKVVCERITRCEQEL